jgi:hypothetical protein
MKESSWASSEGTGSALILVVSIDLSSVRKADGDRLYGSFEYPNTWVLCFLAPGDQQRGTVEHKI